MKALLLIMDGVGDRGKDTSLSRARTPNLDKLAKASVTGLMHPLGRGVVRGRTRRTWRFSGMTRRCSTKAGVRLRRLAPGST